MSACDTCREPGHCCRNIRLFGARRSPAEHGEVVIPATLDPVKYLGSIQGEDLPMLPKAPRQTFEPRPLPDWNGPLIGETVQTWTWSCPRLTAAGRCGDYERRPRMCRMFEPVIDTMCLMHDPAEAARLSRAPQAVVTAECTP